MLAKLISCTFRLRLILTGIALIGTAMSYGQQQSKFKHYTVDDGLDVNLTESLLQDANGFFWFDNNVSLARFDGYSIKTYRHTLGDSLLQLGPELTGGLIKDEMNTIWVNGFDVSGGGAFVGNKLLLKYDAAKDGFIAYKPDIQSFIRCLSVDMDSTVIWLGTGAGLYSFNTTTGKTYPFPYVGSGDSKSHELNGYVRSIVNVGEYLQLFTNNGVWYFNKSNKSFSRPKVNQKDSSLLLSGRVGAGRKRILNLDQDVILMVDSSLNVKSSIKIPQSIVNKVQELDIDNRGVLWATVYDRNLAAHLLRYDPATESLDTLLSDNGGFGVIIDHDQNIWAYGDNGAWRYLAPELPYSINRTKNYVGGGVTILKGAKQSRLINLAYSNQLSILNIVSNNVDAELFSFPQQNERWSNFIFGWQGTNYFWVATWGRGVIGFPIDHQNTTLKKEGIIFYDHIPDNPYTVSDHATWGGIYEDRDGNLWAGTYTAGLNKINRKIQYGKEGSVERFLHRPDDTTSICSNLVQVLVPGDDGDLWLGTPVGLDLLKDGKFIHMLKGFTVGAIFIVANRDVYVGTSSGTFVARKSEAYRIFTRINSIDPFTIWEDSLNRLWMGTAKGVVLFDPIKQLTINLGDQEGLKYSGAVNGLPDGRAGFFSELGYISIFDPLSFKPRENVTRPMLTRLLVNNKVPIVFGHPSLESDFLLPSDIVVLEQLQLDYLHNNFTVEYAAMEMTAPEKNIYRHKLEGYDNDWIETDYKNRTATYTNLPSGTYTFRVKASNHHGAWSDNEKTLKVKILPPPWRTWWAYTGYSLFVVGLLLGARRTIVQRERLKANLQLAKVEQEKEHIELEKAQEVDRVKTSFFTNISHEFRTPLTLIKGPVQNLLEEFAENPKVKERLKLIERNSDLLLKLINQLLDLAKLESGTLKVEKSEGDLFSFVRAISGSFESFARQKNVSIGINVPSENCNALFDKDKLETILINLINNAIKFTPSGGTVTVTAVLRLDTNVLILQVKDTGIGIPADQQNKIFERFHQVSEAHKEVGTGIGLSLVKELINLMGGNISVKSEIGKGSEFKVVMPIELSSQTTSSGESQGVKTTLSRQTPQTTESSQPDTRNSEDDDQGKPHVLVVEDNTDLRHFIIDSLGNEFHFLEAENGRIGLEVATKEIPDLIISDVMMPEMDGITMATKIKKDIHTSHIPLILLTAKSTEDSKLSGLQSGADDYLTKPFNKNELLLKVRNGVNRQQKLREKLRAELMSTAPKVEVFSEDEQFLSSVKEKILERLIDEQLSVESLAEDMGMSRVQLYRKISGLTDISVNELIRKLRLQRAAQLLQQNWGPVSQVAYEVGFSNLSYFSKVFKEEFGTLPSEYPNRI